MKDIDTNILVALGYVLKIMKSGNTVPDEFKEKIKKIRHGAYDEFSELVGGGKPFSIKVGDDCNFFRLVDAGPSLIKFYKECLTEFGDIKDSDIPDDMFRRIAFLEISMRNLASNIGIDSYDFNDVINNVCSYYSFTSEESMIFHNGRKALNAVKHPEKLGVGTYPNTWKEVCQKTIIAYDLMKEKGISIL